MSACFQPNNQPLHLQHSQQHPPCHAWCMGSYRRVDTAAARLLGTHPDVQQLQKVDLLDAQATVDDKIANMIIEGVVRVVRREI